MLQQLKSFHVLEKVKSGDLMWVWSYPGIEDGARTIYKRKCQAAEKFCKEFQFQYFHYCHEWVYMYFSKPDSDSKIAQNILLVCTTDLNSSRYEQLCRIFSEHYCKSRQPDTVLQLFISILTKGQCQSENNEIFYSGEFDNSISTKYQLTDIISRFGLETILIYAALLIKKRIVVYHHDVISLKNFIISLPAFVAHRDVADSLYPWVDYNEDELQYFKESNKFYVIGCTSSAIESSTDLYDLYVNVPAAEVTVAPHSKDMLTMTKIHKDIAVFMMQLLEKKYLSERDVVFEIGKKTTELIGSLKKLSTNTQSGEIVISMESLKKQEFSPITETFLLNLAQAENIRVN